METIAIRNRRYLGSKTKLIDFIKKVVLDECVGINSFADIFAGTGNVAATFNDLHTSIIVNDILQSNYIAYNSWFSAEEFDHEKIQNLINNYNLIECETDNYFSINFKETYFNTNNSRLIGYIREDIESKFNNNEINKREKSILITSLIYAMDRIANTVGHYDAYILGKAKSDRIKMLMLDLPLNEVNRNNLIFNSDANELVKTIEADLVYIDPPYNSRQYSDAYHLLENVAKWDKPEVFGVAKKMKRDESIKSKYCLSSAPRHFSDLISNIKAKYILVSYNNMGTNGAGRSQAKISDADIINALSKRGEVKIFEKEFNQFTTGKSKILDHKERLFLCIVGDEQEYSTLEKINGYAKSPLNYTGGKYKLIPQLFDRMPKKHDVFIDLFGGGFNVGVNVNSLTTIYNDKQKEVARLIKLFYKYDSEYIIDKIDKIIKKYGLSDTNLNGYEYYGCSSDNGVGSFNKESYSKLRQHYNSLKNSEVKDFELLTLIIFAFNNQIRFNSSKEFNMPVGKRDLNSSTRRNIKDFATMIKNHNLFVYSKDFKEIKIDQYANAFIYCDPPYILGNASYNENNGWSHKDENDLLEFLSKASLAGHKFALSNVVEHKGEVHNVLLQWALNNRYNIIYLNANYNNSNYQIKDKNGKTQEVLITNY